MKLIEELSHKELLELTDEQVENYVDVQCLNDGVALVPPQPVAPKKPDAKEDVSAFQVGNIMFQTRADAEELVEFLRNCEVVEPYYISSSYYGPRGVKSKFDAHEIHHQFYWCPKAYEDNKTALIAYEEAQKVYDEAKKEYDDALRGRIAVSDQVWTIVYDARDIHRQEEALKVEFDQYVAIARDKEVAFQCMIKAGRIANIESARKLLDIPEYYDTKELSIDDTNEMH